MVKIMTVSKKYFWYEISGDGLLKLPKGVGEFYSLDYINSTNGFNSELEAIDAFEKFEEKYPYLTDNLTLIPIYSVAR